jgi:hypothetical protein
MVTLAPAASVATQRPEPLPICKEPLAATDVSKPVPPLAGARVRGRRFTARRDTAR